MSDTFFLHCDACNKNLRVEANQHMQLAARFKPSLLRLNVPQVDPTEKIVRCRACGWVNIFVPAILTGPKWYDIVLK